MIRFSLITIFSCLMELSAYAQTSPKAQSDTARLVIKNTNYMALLKKPQGVQHQKLETDSSSNKGKHKGDSTDLRLRKYQAILHKVPMDSVPKKPKHN